MASNSENNFENNSPVWTFESLLTSLPQPQLETNENSAPSTSTSVYKFNSKPYFECSAVSSTKQSGASTKNGTKTLDISKHFQESSDTVIRLRHKLFPDSKRDLDAKLAELKVSFAKMNNTGRMEVSAFQKKKKEKELSRMFQSMTIVQNDSEKEKNAQERRKTMSRLLHKAFQDRARVLDAELHLKASAANRKEKEARMFMKMKYVLQRKKEKEMSSLFQSKTTVQNDNEKQKLPQERSETVIRLRHKLFQYHKRVLDAKLAYLNVSVAKMKKSRKAREVRSSFPNNKETELSNMFQSMTIVQNDNEELKYHPTQLFVFAASSSETAKELEMQSSQSERFSCTNEEEKDRKGEVCPSKE